MRIARHLFATFVLMAPVQMASAQQIEVIEQVIEFDAFAEVEVRADGTSRLIQIFDIERASPDEAAQNRLKEQIAKRIGQWKFSPPTLDGAAVDARTFVRIGMEAEVNEGGGFTVRVVRAYTGPRAVYRVQPGYPKSAAKVGAEGRVVLLLSVNSQGQVASVKVESSDASPGSKSSLRQFETVAQRAVKLWRFQMETVDGKPMEMRMRVPVDFCMEDGSSWCDKQWGKHSTNADDREMAAIDPAVKLLTSVSEPGT
ncbi:MAG: energy transducer TonB [Pseudoxanthomonas sp.]